MTLQTTQLIRAEYKISVEKLASLAIVTFRIPDLSDPTKRAQLPPSQHKDLAASMLKGCALLEQPLAVIQILTAVYLAQLTGEDSYQDIASRFSQTDDIAKYRQSLENLSAKSNTFVLGPEALTLSGLFAERECQTEKAKILYIEAVERQRFKYIPGLRHPMQLPLPTPWNVLGYLLKSDKDPNVRAQAKTYFQQGALEGDDPLSYYEAAAFEDRSDPKWLQYTSKAAASGHRQATVDLAQFYEEASVKRSPILADSKMRKTLNWLLGWRRGSAADLAREWLHAAAIMGHRPSMLRLADYKESVHDFEGAKEYLRLMVAPREDGQAEEWPRLAHMAKQRLTGIKQRF